MSSITREAAAGLAAAHALGLVHRDIKPGNLWLEGEVAGAHTGGRVKILDFGLARVPGEAKLTQEGAIVGTPAYMAPEQARAETVDGRCDLFSLGAVLYLACTGAAPFPGDDALSVLLAAATENPRPPCEVNPEVPGGLSDFILQLLAKDREHRPASALEVVQTQTNLGTPQPQPKRRRSVWVALAALVLVAIGATLLAPIVIRIKGKDGKETVVEVPEASKIAVIDKGKVQIELPKDAPNRLCRLVAQWQDLGLIRFRLHDLALGGRLKVDDEDLGRTQESHSRSEMATRWNSPGFGLSRWHCMSLGWATGQSVMEPTGHQAEVNRIRWSADGKHLLTASFDKTVCTSEAQTGKTLRTFTDYQSQVIDAVWSADRKTGASVGNDNKIHLWDPLSGTIRRTIDNWDPLSGTIRRTIDNASGIKALACSPDGKVLATVRHMRQGILFDSGPLLSYNN